MSIPVMINYMFKYWRMMRPEVLITVTGGAQDFDLSPVKLSTFENGLASAAKSTNAWIITAGSGTQRAAVMPRCRLAS